MQSGFSTYKITPSAQYTPTQQADLARSQTLTGIVLVVLPIVVMGAIVSYHKYKAKVTQRQIQHLNRVWQLDSSTNLS